MNFTEENFVPFQDFLKKKMESKKFRRAFQEEMNRLELAYEIKLLRQKNKMTQSEVASRVKMPQSVIARVESGKHNLSLATLHKIAGVFDKRVGLVTAKSAK